MTAVQGEETMKKHVAVARLKTQSKRRELHSLVPFQIHLNVHYILLEVTSLLHKLHTH